MASKKLFLFFVVIVVIRWQDSNISWPYFCVSINTVYIYINVFIPTSYTIDRRTDSVLHTLSHTTHLLNSSGSHFKKKKKKGQQPLLLLSLSQNNSKSGPSPSLLFFKNKNKNHASSSVKLWCKSINHRRLPSLTQPTMLHTCEFLSDSRMSGTVSTHAKEIWPITH